MATQLEITEARNQFTELLDRARAGEEIILSEGGTPVAKLGPADSSPRRKGLGMFKGRVWMSDDFANPLTDEELKDWGL